MVDYKQNLLSYFIIDRHFDCFQFEAPSIILLGVFWCMSPDEESRYFLEHFSSGDVAGSQDMNIYTTLLPPQAFPQSSWANSHQQCIRVPIAPYPCYYLVLSHF